MMDFEAECPSCKEQITVYCEVDGHEVLGVSLEEGEDKCPLCGATWDPDKLYELAQAALLEQQVDQADALLDAARDREYDQ